LTGLQCKIRFLEFAFCRILGRQEGFIVDQVDPVGSHVPRKVDLVAVSSEYAILRREESSPNAVPEWQDYNFGSVELN